MHLDQIPRRLQKLAREGLEYRIGPASSPEAIDAAEARLGVTFPSQVRQFYGAINGIEVVEPPFRLYPLTEVDREGAFLKFCLCDHVHQLAFDTRALN